MEVGKQPPAKIQKLKRVDSSKTETIFRGICFAMFVAFVLSAPGFLSFRQYCMSKGYYVFYFQSLKWFLSGFFVVFGIKYTYFYLMQNAIQSVIKLSDPESDKKKTKLMLKLSYDTFFYAIVSIFSYWNFRKQYWFPVCVGGIGACDQIYRDYPDWPKQGRSDMQVYFCFQLGVHVFSIFELAIFKKDDRKFWEWMLHHFMASSLILYSMVCNLIAVGLMILIVHDASDVFLASSRFFFETKMKKSPLMTIIPTSIVFVTWIYTRNIMYPTCLVANIYDNIPTVEDEWYLIKWEYIYLLVMTAVLACMHVYWTYFLIKSVIISLSKKSISNEFDIDQKQKAKKLKQ